MKKTLLSMTAAVAVIGAANAGIKETCLKHPDKLMWVEKTEACVPINPCKSDNTAIKEAYCNTAFKDIQLGNWRQGATVVEEYVRSYLGISATIKELKDHGVETSLFGQDYVRAVLSDGGYMVFEFDDLSDIAGGDKYDGAAEAACLIYGGRYMSRLRAVGTGLYCRDISESGCNAVTELASKILGDVLFTGKYDDPLRATTDDGSNVLHESVCTLVVEK